MNDELKKYANDYMWCPSCIDENLNIMTKYVLYRRNILIIAIFIHILLIIALLALTGARRAFLAMIMNFIYFIVLLIGLSISIKLSMRYYMIFIITMSLSICLSIVLMIVEAFVID